MISPGAISLFHTVASRQELIKRTVINTAIYEEIVLFFRSRKEVKFNSMVGFNVLECMPLTQLHNPPTTLCKKPNKPELPDDYFHCFRELH